MNKRLASIMLAVSLLPITTAIASTHEFALKNGLKLIVKEDHRAPVVTSQVWYKVGASYEPTGITGISHVLEHMMFKGTDRYPVGEFSKIISEHGGEENAATGADITVYYETLAAEHLPISLELEADRMQNLQVKQVEFDKEIEVVKEERRLRVDDNPQGLMVERLNAVSYVSSPYQRPIIGWMRDLDVLTVDAVKDWYQQWYAPNNATVVVAGDVKPKAVLALVEHYFGDIPAMDMPTLLPSHDQKPLGERRLDLQLPAQLPSLVMAYNVPTLVSAENKTEAYALEVLNAILDGGRSARLPKQLVREQGIAYQAGASYQLLSRLDGQFLLKAVPTSTHDLEELKAALQSEIEELKTTLVTPKELARVKAQVLAEKFFIEDSIFYQAYIMGTLESVGLSWRDAEGYVESIQSITAEDIKAVAKKYLVSERLTTATLTPTNSNNQQEVPAHA